MRDFEWTAVYDDGRSVTSRTINPDTGKAFSSDRIDRSRLRQFDLHISGLPRIRLALDSSKKLIYFRRKDKAPGVGEIIHHFVGFQKNITKGRNVQSILVVDERGGLYLIDGFKEGHPLFHPPSIQRMLKMLK